MTFNALLSDSDPKTLFEYLYPPALSGDDPGSDGDIELPLRDGLDPDVVTLNNAKCKTDAPTEARSLLKDKDR